MQKRISVSGKFGKHTGVIKVTTNYKSETKSVHNPSTHEDNDVKVFYHKVEALYADGKVYRVKEKLKNKDEILKAADDLEKDFTNWLKELANTEPKVTLEDELKNRGYE